MLLLGSGFKEYWNLVFSSCLSKVRIHFIMTSVSQEIVV